MSTRIRDFQDYQESYDVSIKQNAAYWEKVAKEYDWKKTWNKVSSGDFTNVDFKWFEGAQLNITENCLDRHLADRGDQVAVIFEPNNPNEKEKKLTYKELHEQVCKTANALKELGVKKGDRICFYMGMVPELMIGVLACARVGAIHSVVFGGFSANSLADRINDCQSQLLVTNDGSLRGDKIIKLKDIADEAIKMAPVTTKVLVHKRAKNDITMVEGRDIDWNEIVEKQSSEHQAQVMNAEDPLFILYTSGSTGKPKGVMHTCGGYMVYAGHSFQNVFQVNEGDTYWCTADIGWITGHTYITYGPLLKGATTLMFEGVPTWPDGGRFWQVCDKYQVTHFYTAPTAIRALEACDQTLVEKSDLSSLKVLGTVGEPINEEAWNWYNEKVGKGRCPIVDTWWQTETGGIMISPLAGITKTKPSFATLPLPGIEPVLMDEKGNEIQGNNVSGNLCIKRSWPGQARTIWGDHQRFKQTYFATYKGYYFTGDGCLRDDEGFYRITGRVDDVINVSGHRLGTAEIEDAINQHPDVVESAVVGYPHEIKGQGIYAYVICPKGSENPESMRKEIVSHVRKVIGPVASPDKIQIVSGLPKTRSGKIMRRILRKVAAGEADQLGDTSTLLDPSVVEEIKSGAL